MHHLRQRCSPRPYVSLLRPGCPAAPDEHRLPLLSSEPGGVHGSPPRRTRPSTPLYVDLTGQHRPRMAFDPARAGCGLQRTASSPSSTAVHIIDPWYNQPIRPATRPGDLGRVRHRRDGSGGEGGIRTLEGVNPTRFPVARTRPDYATSPGASFTLARQHLSERETRLRRRGWDSNPRGLSHPTRFRDGRTRPGYATPRDGRPRRRPTGIVYQAPAYICSGALTPISFRVFARTRWQAATSARRACFSGSSSDRTLQASLS